MDHAAPSVRDKRGEAALKLRIPDCTIAHLPAELPCHSAVSWGGQIAEGDRSGRRQYGHAGSPGTSIRVLVVGICSPIARACRRDGVRGRSDGALLPLHA